MLALLCDHAENPVEFYIVQAIEADDLCKFGVISSKQWKVIAISVSEPLFYIVNYVVFKYLLTSLMQGSRVLPKLFTFFGVPLRYLDGQSFQDCRPSCIELTNLCERPICSLFLDSSYTAQWIRKKKDEDKGKPLSML